MKETFLCTKDEPKPVYHEIEQLSLQYNMRMDMSNYLLYKFIEFKKGMANHHMNHWINNELGEFLRKRKVYVANNDDYLVVTKIKFKKPMNDDKEFYPYQARLLDRDYVATLSIWMDWENNPSDESGKGFKLNDIMIPAEIGSLNCNLYKMDNDERVAHGEIDDDHTGFYVMDGSDIALHADKKLRVGKMMITPAKNKQKTAKKDTELEREVEQNMIMRMTCVTNKYHKIVHVVKQISGEFGLKLQMMKKSTTGKEQFMNCFAPFLILSDKKSKTGNEIMEEILQCTLPEWRDEVEKSLMISKIKYDSIGKSKKSHKSEIYDMINSESVNIKKKDIPDLIMDDLFPQIKGYGKKAKKRKLETLAVMLCMYGEYWAELIPANDRDNWSCKRVHFGAMLIHGLFSTLWNKFLDKVESEIPDEGEVDYSILSGCSKEIKDISRHMKMSFITSTWGKVGIKSEDRTGITERIKPGLMARIDNMSRMVTQTKENSKQDIARELNGSQVGRECIIETADGAGVGLTGNCAIGGYVSINRDPDWLAEILEDHISPTMSDETPNIFLINGVSYGWCNSLELYNIATDLRRSDKIYYDICFYISPSHHLLAETTSGRMLRTLLVVKDGEIVGKDSDFTGKSIKKMINLGIIEMLDMNEEEQFALVGSDPRNIHERKLKADQILDEKEREEFLLLSDYTHCELNPSMVFGWSGACIGRPDMNPGPRNQTQAKMNTQITMTKGRLIDRLRIDNDYRVIPNAVPRIYQTPTSAFLGFEDYAIPALCAIMPFESRNMEDSCVISEKLFNSPYFACDKITSLTYVVPAPSTYSYKIGFPVEEKNMERFSDLDENGIIKMNTYVKKGDVVINVLRTETVRDEKTHTIKKIVVNYPIKADVSQKGYVSKIYETYSVESSKMIKIEFTNRKRLKIGDKFQITYAQKFTVGSVEKQMPIVLDGPYKGCTIDICLNPTSVISRTTMSMLCEFIANAHAYKTCERFSSEACIPRPFEDIAESVHPDMNNSMCKLLDTKSGLEIQTPINVSTICLASLKHMVDDKEQAAASADKDRLTHQPVGGRKREGNVRDGRQERDAKVSAGMAAVVENHINDRSDGQDIVICQKCGMHTDYIDKCRICGTETTGVAKMPYSMVTVSNLLRAMHMKMYFETKNA